MKSAPRASHFLAGFLFINKEKALKQKRSKPFLVAQKEGFESALRFPKNASGLRCPSHFLTAADQAPALLLPPAAAGRLIPRSARVQTFPPVKQGSPVRWTGDPCLAQKEGFEPSRRF